MSRQCYVFPNGSRVTEEIIAVGLDGVIIKRGPYALKVPKAYGTVQSDGKVVCSEEQHTSLEHEKDIYDRLSGVEGVAQCHSFTAEGLLLDYYENGSLDNYLIQHTAPDIHLKHKWILEIVDIITKCHSRRVLVSDIALRNILFTTDYSIRIIDFANSVVVPDEHNFASGDVTGCTPKLDLFHLANVIMSVATWEDFSVECAAESEWPDNLEDIAIEGNPWATFIRNCWSRAYENAEELHHDLSLMTLERLAEHN